MRSLVMSLCSHDFLVIFLTTAVDLTKIIDFVLYYFYHKYIYIYIYIYIIYIYIYNGRMEIFLLELRIISKTIARVVAHVTKII